MAFGDGAILQNLWLLKEGEILYHHLRLKWVSHDLVGPSLRGWRNPGNKYDMAAIIKNISRINVCQSNIMTTKERNFTSWNWGRSPWRKIFRSSWSFWGMWNISGRKELRSKVSSEVYLSVTKIGLSSPILRLLKRLYEWWRTTMSREKGRSNPSWKGNFRRGFERKKRELMCPYAQDFSKKGKHN